MIKPIVEESLSTSKIKKSSLDLEGKLNALSKGMNTLNKSIQANTFTILATENNRLKHNLLRKLDDKTATSVDFSEYLVSLSAIGLFIMFERFNYSEHCILCDMVVNGINLIKKHGGDLSGNEDSIALEIYNNIDKYKER